MRRSASSARRIASSVANVVACGRYTTGASGAVLRAISEEDGSEAVVAEAPAPSVADADVADDDDEDEDDAEPGTSADGSCGGSGCPRNRSAPTRSEEDDDEDDVAGAGSGRVRSGDRGGVSGGPCSVVPAETGRPGEKRTEAGTTALVSIAARSRLADPVRTESATRTEPSGGALESSELTTGATKNAARSTSGRLSTSSRPSLRIMTSQGMRTRPTTPCFPRRATASSK